MKRYRSQSPARTKALRRRHWPFWWTRRGVRCQHCNRRYTSYSDYQERDRCSYRGTTSYDAAFAYAGKLEEYLRVERRASDTFYHEAVLPMMAKVAANAGME